MAEAFAVRLKRREIVAAGTGKFTIERPAGFTFQAGQNISLGFPPDAGLPDNERFRTLTIASHPSDADLVVATRLRDTPYKRALSAAGEGSRFEMRGPYGSFVLRGDELRPLVFIAGGMGITPMRSILQGAAAGEEDGASYLFYSNRAPADAAFLEEFQSLHALRPALGFIPTMTDPASVSSGWRGETRRINPAMLLRYLPDPAVASYFVAGPPAMVRDMRQMLSSMGVERARLRIEMFGGY